MQIHHIDTLGSSPLLIQISPLQKDAYYGGQLNG